MEDKKEAFCSNCIFYKYDERFNKKVCLNPTPYQKDIANRQVDSYCPYHEFKKTKRK